jgi:hypothetical protein
MKFDALRGHADKLVLKARELQSEFWVELGMHNPSLARLDGCVVLR